MVVNGTLLLALAVLVFVPVRFIYPSRTPGWRIPTNVLGALWGIVVWLGMYYVVLPLVGMGQVARSVPLAMAA